MRNGARPRRRSPVPAPGLSQSPEIQSPEVGPPETRPPETRPPEDEFAAQGGEEVVESPVRGPIEPPRRGPIEPPAAREAESVETPDVAARPEAVGKVAKGKAPAGKAPASESYPSNGLFEVPVEASEPSQVYAAAEPDFEPVRAVVPAIADPATEIRFARLHLRTGSLLQARSEYESLAGGNLLDVPATLDLAEVRWRTGDLIGAGRAAAAYLAANGEEALGFLIAAEAAAAQDHVADARRHAGRALERSVANLEVCFAGVPRRMTWPESTWRAPAAMKFDAAAPAAAPDRAAPTPVVAEPPTEAPDGSLWARTEELPAPPPEAVEVEPEVARAKPIAVDQDEAPESEPAATVAAELPAPQPEGQWPTPGPHPWDGEVAAGTAALQAGDALMAALHFAVALRMTPESARAVVDGIGERRDLALELVRGDALRLLGNESDAGEAYASVASALGKPWAAAQHVPAPEPAAPQPAAPASKAASTPEPAKTPKVDEPPAIRWE